MFLITIFDSRKYFISTKFTGREVLYPPISKVTHPMHHSMVSLSQQNAQYSYPRREIENAETIAFAEIAISATNVSGGIHWTVTSQHTIDQRETYVGIDTAGQPSCRRFLARYSGAGASIAGAECLAGRTGTVSPLSGVHVMDTDDFPSFDDTYDWLLLTVLEFDDFANLRDVVRRNVPSSLSEKSSLRYLFKH